GPPAHLGLRVLVGTLPVADGPAQARHPEAGRLHHPAVHVDASGHPRRIGVGVAEPQRHGPGEGGAARPRGALWIVVPRHVQQRHGGQGQQVLQVFEGEVATGGQQVGPELAQGLRAERRIDLIGDHQDANRRHAGTSNRGAGCHAGRSTPARATATRAVVNRAYTARLIPKWNHTSPTIPPRSPGVGWAPRSRNCTILAECSTMCQLSMTSAASSTAAGWSPRLRHNSRVAQIRKSRTARLNQKCTHSVLKWAPSSPLRVTDWATYTWYTCTPCSSMWKLCTPNPIRSTQAARLEMGGAGHASSRPRRRPRRRRTTG